MSKPWLCTRLLHAGMKNCGCNAFTTVCAFAYVNDNISDYKSAMKKQSMQKLFTAGTFRLVVKCLMGWPPMFKG